MKTPATSSAISSEFLLDLDRVIGKSQDLSLAQQFKEGYWWYTLEANESIAAEYIFLTEFLGVPNSQINQGLCQRILKKQREDGSWAIFHNGPGDLGASIECYWALKHCGYSMDSAAMVRAREFILNSGGPTQARVFTKIHLALFGLAPWEAVPNMPLALVLAPASLPINIYEFSSWARACIIPLLVLMNERYSHPLSYDLNELYPQMPKIQDWGFKPKEKTLSLENFFIGADQWLKWLDRLKIPSLLPKKSLKKCSKYIREHIEKTEDIFPALAYGAMALKVLGYSAEDAILQKALRALRSFQQMDEAQLPAIPKIFSETQLPAQIHQQCCISPVWDTPWMAYSLLESGIAVKHPALVKTARWLEQKQILETAGDWAIKNKNAEPGGWSFEFENEYYPDVDDTIEVLTFLFKMGLQSASSKTRFERGVHWLLSMQSKNGGWAAFDVDNTRQWVNCIPFSDHGACLDPPTADITGRMLEFLALIGYDEHFPFIQKAKDFVLSEQTSWGAWEGRWGVNYIYGTWCAVQGIMALDGDASDPALLKAKDWLIAQQNWDGGWGESCESYRQKNFVSLNHSVPSQTAWALMTLIALGLHESPEARRAVDYLMKHQNPQGSWNEEDYTGTGFPGHFYIRYHGYRHYFPLLALAKFKKANNNS